MPGYRYGFVAAALLSQSPYREAPPTHARGLKVDKYATLVDASKFRYRLGTVVNSEGEGAQQASKTMAEHGPTSAEARGGALFQFKAGIGLTAVGLLAGFTTALAPSALVESLSPLCVFVGCLLAAAAVERDARG